jgi:16S rRNA G527 N7-methylase RsmG
VNGSPFRELLSAGTARAGLIVESAQTNQLVAYFDILQRWNRTINLTALPLDPPTTEAIDRLFVEPLAAARFLRSRRLPIPNPESRPPNPESRTPNPESRIPNPESRPPNPESPVPVWIDLGSGGGSPAIPMKIALPELDLTMVESRSRKAAFLSEVIRGLGLERARVENARIEELSTAGSADFITSRAIRIDATLESIAQRLLRPAGWLMTFGPATPMISAPSFIHVETVQLTDSFFHISANVPRGTNPLTSI